jgi:hypothetical protein
MARRFFRIFSIRYGFIALAYLRDGFHRPFKLDKTAALPGKALPVLQGNP